MTDKIILWDLVLYVKGNNILYFKNDDDCHTFSPSPFIPFYFCAFSSYWAFIVLGTGEIFSAILELIFLWGYLVSSQ